MFRGRGRASSGGYVDSWPDDRCTRIPDELELNAVLENLGMRGPAVTVVHVRAEAQRRIVALTGASDHVGCFAKQLNALMRGQELAIKMAAEGLSEGEQAEAAGLHGLAAAIKAVRARSNAMEADPPADYQDDLHWA